MAGHWTAAEIPDQSGRVAVVTGANSGLGLATARALAGAGARVVMACRNVQKGEDAAQTIRAAQPAGEVAVEELDLGDLDSVRAFAERIPQRLDLLINNAGVMAAPRRLTRDGLESQLGTNHLGHFALTGLLLGRLLAAAEARAVTVSSNLHRTGTINFEDLHGEGSYNRWKAYGQFYERAFMVLGNRLFAQSAEMGALPTLYAATVPDLPGGTYIGPDGRNGQRGYPSVVTAAAKAYDEDDWRRLWEVSEKLTGVRYDFQIANAA